MNTRSNVAVPASASVSQRLPCAQTTRKSGLFIRVVKCAARPDTSVTGSAAIPALPSDRLSRTKVPALSAAVASVGTRCVPNPWGSKIAAANAAAAKAAVANAAAAKAAVAKAAVAKAAAAKAAAAKAAAAKAAAVKSAAGKADTGKVALPQHASLPPESPIFSTRSSVKGGVAKEKTVAKGPHGHRMCKHGKRKTQCKLCHGNSICMHGRQKHKCKDCGGEWGGGGRLGG